MIFRDYQNNWTNDGRRPSFVLFLNEMIYIHHLSLRPKEENIKRWLILGFVARRKGLKVTNFTHALTVPALPCYP